MCNSELAIDQQNIAVEDMKFGDKPKARSLYIKQKLDSTSWQCRHLKPLKRITLLDYKNDETIDVEVCPQCDKIMEDEDIKQRNINLKKWDKAKIAK